MSLPRILGEPAGSLRDASWLKPSAQGSARVGAAGERRTAAILNALTTGERGVTVLHDLTLPSARYQANLDHVIVSGNVVHIIDAKVWKPGRYWTVGGRTRRGWERFEPADKQTMAVAQKAVTAFLRARGLDAHVVTPTLVVWPSSTRAALRLGLLKVPGAQAWPAEVFQRRIAKMYGRRRLITGSAGRPADPHIVAALATLLKNQQHLSSDTGFGPGYGTGLAAEGW